MDKAMPTHFFVVRVMMLDYNELWCQKARPSVIFVRNPKSVFVLFK
jgi:hypothetical protein